MSYKIFYTKTAVKDIKKLDVVVKRKIKSKIELYSQGPTSHAKKLIDSKIGTYRWRIGNYRIVFDIEGKNIVVLRIGHRKEIYRSINERFWASQNDGSWQKFKALRVLPSYPFCL